MTTGALCLLALTILFIVMLAGFTLTTCHSYRRELENEIREMSNAR